MVAIAADPKPLRDMIAQNTGMARDDIADCPRFLTGSATARMSGLQCERPPVNIKLGGRVRHDAHASRASRVAERPNTGLQLTRARARREVAGSTRAPTS